MEQTLQITRDQRRAGSSPAMHPRSAGIVEREWQRLAALHSLDILDTESEQQYDDLTRLASLICGTPMAMMSLVDRDRQWFKSRVGIELSETPRSESICTYTIEQQDLFVVNDAQQDARFCELPLVADGTLRFYAGAPISSPEGEQVGSLCVLDNKPRELTDEQKVALEILSRQAAAALIIRRQVQQLVKAAEERATVERELRHNQGMLQEANRLLQQLATTDVLTGLANRRMLEATLSALALQHRSAGPDAEPFSLLTIDVDHFKRVNDTFGHDTGDRVLRRIAEILRSSIRGDDTLGRFGGEEFLLLLPATRHEAAVALAERLRTAVEEDRRSVVQVTVSIGVATLDGSIEDGREEGIVSALLCQADEALYCAKREGRNCVRSAALEPEQFKAALAG